MRTLVLFRYLILNYTHMKKCSVLYQLLWLLLLLLKLQMFCQVLDCFMVCSKHRKLCFFLKQKERFPQLLILVVFQIFKCDFAFVRTDPLLFVLHMFLLLLLRAQLSANFDYLIRVYSALTYLCNHLDVYLYARVYFHRYADVRECVCCCYRCGCCC